MYQVTLSTLPHGGPADLDGAEREVETLDPQEFADSTGQAHRFCQIGSRLEENGRHVMVWVEAVEATA